MRIGYARVSTKHQNLGRQIDALKRAKCEVIFQEKASGSSTKNRPKLAKALAMLKKGDVFVVAEWDRATRSMIDGFDIIAKVHSRDAGLKVLDRSCLDLSTPSGKAMLGLLSAFCQEERERNAKRCKEGTAYARRSGIKFGRPRKMKADAVKAAVGMLKSGLSQRVVADEFDVSLGTINRIAKTELHPA